LSWHPASADNGYGAKLPESPANHVNQYIRGLQYLSAGELAMRILKRLSAVLLALILLAAVIYLGFLSGEDAKYVVWFGIASAIVAPMGLSLFGYAIRTSEAEVIQQLAKVPEIAHLVQQAQTYEEKIKGKRSRGKLVENQ
jgi:hypothetical protein